MKTNNTHDVRYQIKQCFLCKKFECINQLSQYKAFGLACIFYRQFSILTPGILINVSPSYHSSMDYHTTTVCVQKSIGVDSL